MSGFGAGGSARRGQCVTGPDVTGTLPEERNLAALVTYGPLVDDA